MDEIAKNMFSEAFKQAPQLTVLCFLVWIFLKAMKERDGVLRALHDEHLAARGESREAIRENTFSNREVTRAITLMSQGQLYSYQAPPAQQPPQPRGKPPTVRSP